MICFYVKYDAKPLPKLLEEGKEWGKIPLLSYSSRRGKRKVIGSFLNYYAFEMIRESSLMLKVVFDKS